MEPKQRYSESIIMHPSIDAFFNNKRDRNEFITNMEAIERADITCLQDRKGVTVFQKIYEALQGEDVDKAIEEVTRLIDKVFSHAEKLGTLKCEETDKNPLGKHWSKGDTCWRDISGELLHPEDFKLDNIRWLRDVLYFRIEATKQKMESFE